MAGPDLENGQIIRESLLYVVNPPCVLNIALGLSTFS